MKRVYLNIILTIAFIFLIFCFLFLETWVHEEAHVLAANNYGINFHIDSINYKFDINKPFDWGDGKAAPSLKVDCEKFNSLSKADQKVITHAGVKMQLLIFIPLFLIFFIACVISYNTVGRTYPFLWFYMALLAILFATIAILSIYGNVFQHFLTGTPNPTDWYAGNFNCSSFG